MRRCLAVAVLVGATPLLGCGGADKSKSQPTGKPDMSADRVAQRYVDAYTAENAKAICSLVASSVRKDLGGKKCEKTIQTSFRKGHFDKFKVERSFVNGANATVTFQDSPRQVALVREGATWKVINGGN